MAPRHVLITGTSRGIGEALAEHYLAAGDHVVGCGRSPSSLTHERYTHCALDVTDAGAVDRPVPGSEAAASRRSTC